MPRIDWSHEQAWMLGQLDAPRRAASVGELLRVRLRPVLDWGFTLEITEGGLSVSLGRLSILSVLCESDPMNADGVTNYLAERKGPGEFARRFIVVEDKTTTGQVALEQLELAAEVLRRASDELAAPDVPMGWLEREF